MKQKDARNLHPVIQEDIRHKAVELFLKGFTKVHIATMLCVSRRSIYKWVTAYEQSGDKGLKACKRGRPEGTQLEP